MRCWQIVVIICYRFIIHQQLSVFSLISTWQFLLLPRLLLLLLLLMLRLSGRSACLARQRTIVRPSHGSTALPHLIIMRFYSSYQELIWSSFYSKTPNKLHIALLVRPENATMQQAVSILKKWSGQSRNEPIWIFWQSSIVLLQLWL